jgi:hypothetical protein
MSEERLVIYANSDVSRGKYAAAAVHAALYHYGIDHGAVIVLGAHASQIEERCELVIHDAGRSPWSPPPCPGCVTPADRALWARLAAEVDAYLDRNREDTLL